MTYRELLVYGQEVLEKAEVPDAATDSWYLFEYCMGMRRVDYYMNQTKVVPEEDVCRYETYIAERKERKPLQYIIGEQEFMGYTFEVNPHVLIPRQDTEVLVEEVIKGLRTEQPASVLDMCTGSGCIIISLAKELQLQNAVAVDISSQALQVAKRNAENNKADVNFIESDLFEQVTGQYDVIVSNPPYIESYEVTQLMPEVRCYEPVLALDGKEDGLYFYRRIIEQAGRYLKEHGKLYFEIGCEQGEAVQKLMQAAGYTDVCVKKDLAGLDRIVSGRFCG